MFEILSECEKPVSFFHHHHNGIDLMRLLLISLKNNRLCEGLSFVLFWGSSPCLQSVHHMSLQSPPTF